MAVDAQHGTLVASTVATVTLVGDYTRVEVLNRSGTAEIFFTVDDTAPTVAGSGTYILPAIAGASLVTPSPSAAATIVRLISSGTPTYSVTGVV